MRQKAATAQTVKVETQVAEEVVEKAGVEEANIRPHGAAEA